MLPTLSPEDIDRLARRRAGSKLGWYAHAIIFVLVNAVIFAMSRYGFGQRPWSVYPLLGWGFRPGITRCISFRAGQRQQAARADGAKRARTDRACAKRRLARLEGSAVEITCPLLIHKFFNARREGV